MTSVHVPTSVAAALPTLAVFDITNDVHRELRSRGLQDGLAYVTAQSPAAVVRITEREAGFFCDFEALLARLVPLGARSRERLLLALLGARTEQVPFTAGRLCLGQWQRVLLFGFAGEPSAGFYLTTIG